MDTIAEVEEVKTIIRKMSQEELSIFRNWFAEFDAEAWDRQFEDDVHAGRLNALADEALKDLEQGRCTDI